MVTTIGDKVQLQSKDSGATDESTAFSFDQNDGWILLEFKVRINTVIKNSLVASQCLHDIL
jgi:hypothetical protein